MQLDPPPLCNQISNQAMYWFLVQLLKRKKNMKLHSFYPQIYPIYSSKSMIGPHHPRNHYPLFYSLVQSIKLSFRKLFIKINVVWKLYLKWVEYKQAHNNCNMVLFNKLLLLQLLLPPLLLLIIIITIIIISKVKLATIVEGDPKAPFSIAYYTKV